MAARGRGALRASRLGLALGLALAPGFVVPQVASAQTGPLSAIDWLSRATEAPPTGRPLPEWPSPALPAPELPGPELTGPALPAPSRGIGDITVTPLDGPTTDALGLLPADRAGLPRDLWGMTSAATLAEALSALGPDTLPVLQGLILTLLVAELDPPRDAEGRGALFLARLDRLMAFGALDPALALVEAAGPATDPTTDHATDPALFARWFDLSLLTGDAGPACAQLRRAPALAPDPAARVYCAARAGAWDDAEALLTGPDGRAIDPPLRRALARFLDPEAAYDVGVPPPVAQPTPLMWQILDALGEGGTTAQLPLAFAHADLGSTTGWKSRLEAAERLARAGALTPNRLLGLYTQRVPAASGGVWDRVAAVQALDAALVAGAPDAVAEALPRAWAAMADAELEAPLADLMAARIDGASLPPEAAALAWRMALLAGHPAPAPPPLPGAARRDGFLAAIATDTLDAGTPLPPGAMPAAVAEGLTAAPDPDTARLLTEARRGEVLLHALALLQGGGIEDPRVVTAGLRALRAAGQDRLARRAALQLLLLDRRG